MRKQLKITIDKLKSSQYTFVIESLKKTRGVSLIMKSFKVANFNIVVIIVT